MRINFLRSCAKTTVETFLSILDFRGKKRMDFVQGVQLPSWIKLWMSQKDLLDQTIERCVESPDNTRHWAKGQESVKTLVDAYLDDALSEEFYKRLIFMSVCIRHCLCNAVREDHSAIIRPVRGVHYALRFAPSKTALQ
jgi:hypothetical protein